jgi:thiol-disulfide isomerase/thioredoxin
MRRLPRVTAPLAALFIATAVSAQQPAAAPTPAPTPPPMDDLRFIRMKLSAGDLPSAESILEVHRAEKGEDAEYVRGLAWVARGAALVGDWPAASRYARQARAAAASRLGTPPDYDGHPEATYALGTAIEVEAQALVAAGKKSEAVRLLDDSSRSLTNAPYNLRARVWKRRDQIELVGQKAPDIKVDDRIGAPFTSLEALKGKPVVLFFWWASCGDCKAQAAAYGRIVAKYAPKGVVFVAPTRYYEKDRAAEKADTEKAWREIYGAPEGVAVPISDEAMLRYGVSATPTFAFVDRKGMVTGYQPYRMTEERLAAAIDELLRPAP